MWSNFFTAGDAWLLSYQVLEANRDDIAWGIFYVEPTIVSFCLELFIKAVTSHQDQAFNSKKYNHRTSDIIEDYAQQIPIFHKYADDPEFMALTKEFQKTIDVKYGEMGVEIDGSDRDKILNAIYELRAEMCKRTGLR